MNPFPIVELEGERAPYDNIYAQREDESGAPLGKVYETVPLGLNGGAENPNQVNDYDDDPGLGHT